MRSSTRIMRGLALAIVAIGVSACSGEPSERDILDALRGNEQMRAQLELMFSVNRGFERLNGGTANNDSVDALMKRLVVEKSGCAGATGAPGYVCDFRVADGRENLGPSSKGRFFKSSNGWIYEPMR